LNNQGTMVIKGNLINNNTSMSSLGSGSFVFSGATHQTISGPNQFTNFEIANPYGVKIIKGPTQIDGILTLTSGLLSLDTCTLTLSINATIAGSPSSTKMIKADSTGQLRKIFTGTGSFTFPVGDSARTTADYSPVTLNFTSGSFGTNAYAGLNLRNRKYNDSNLTGDSLKRYWTVTTSNITSPICNATFQYIPADVAGVESNLYCLSMSPLATYSAANTGNHTLTANGLTSFGAFTGGHAGLTSSFTAFLEGPFDGTSAMNTNLYTQTLIPPGQPYNTTPWLYGGLESASPTPSGVVDWVLVELRQATTPANATSSTIFSKRAAFLKSDGTIVDVDGVSAVKFYNAAVTTGNYVYPVIRHRNHLAIMAGAANGASKDPLTGIYSYNFSTGSGQTYLAGCKNLNSTGIWGMLAGDGDADGTIQLSDYFLWRSNAGASNYNMADYTLDGTVQLSDYFQWRTNAGALPTVP